eukprot:scaffold103040_cov45-Phaeocystis_antarctica.AAC.1
MGANVGTSVTSTIVALGQSGNPDEFRRAHPRRCATWMSVRVRYSPWVRALQGAHRRVAGDLGREAGGARHPQEADETLHLQDHQGVDKKLINKLAEASKTDDCDGNAPGAVEYTGEP